MKARDLKSCRKAKSILAVFLFVCLFSPFLATAGIPEKYGEECTTSDRKRYYNVKFSVRNNPVLEYPSILPESSYTYIEYYLDDTVLWYWGRLVDDSITIRGTRIDEAGSFKVKAGDFIGFTLITLYPSYNTDGADINIYPMMQFEGKNILLTDRDEIIFRVGQDGLIRMECNKENLPSQAKIGFGPIFKDYYELLDLTNKIAEYQYGPRWQMLLDFSMKPLYPKQDAIDEIIDDAAETDTPIYDIVGQRVGTDKDNLTPGIYIYKGQKILVK